MPSLRNVWRRVRGVDPVLSVVVPVYNVADYLEPCLDSLLGQSLAELEVIAVDDGSSDGSAEILRRRAARDPRLRVLSQANAGPGAARNRAVAEARGEFLTFCDGDDRVPVEAYAYLVDTLRASGSDFAVGRARRFDATGLLGPARVRGVHGTDRRHVTAAEYPEAMHDLILCNRVFRTDFWRGSVGEFPEGVVYEDHLPMVTAFVRARAFDLLQRTVYHWRVREDNTSTTQQRSTLQNLRDRIDARESAHELLRSEAPKAVYETWVARGLSAAWPGFIPGALEGDDAFKDLLAGTYRSYLERADDAAMALVQHAPRVLAHLCAQERWDDVAEALEYFDGWGHHPRLVVDHGEVRAVPEPGLGFAAHVPPELWRLADRETNLLAGFRSASWVAPDALELSGFVAIRGLDASETVPAVTGSLRDVETDERVAAGVRVERDPEVNQWVRHANADYDNGRFVARIDPSALPPRSATWAVVLEVEHLGVSRDGQVYDFVTGAPYVRDVGRVVDGRLVEALRDDEHGLVVRVHEAPKGWSQPAEPRAPHVQDVVVEGDRVVLRLAPDDGDPPSAVRLTGKRGQVSLEPVAGDPTGWRIPADPPPRSGVYDLECDAGDPVPARPSPELASRSPYSLLSPSARVGVKVRVTGVLRVDVAAPLDDQERTALGQRRLQRHHRDEAVGEVRADVTLVHAFGDETPAGGTPDGADTPGAVLYVVRDLSEAVPAGAEAVVLGTRRWYDALSTAGLLVSALDPPPWFRARPGQRVLRPRADPA
jgi:glycosyltransferase involved in cell wall biosynthesis